MPLTYRYVDMNVAKMRRHHKMTRPPKTYNFSPLKISNHVKKRPEFAKIWENTCAFPRQSCSPPLAPVRSPSSSSLPPPLPPCWPRNPRPPAPAAPARAPAQAPGTAPAPAASGAPGARSRRGPGRRRPYQRGGGGGNKEKIGD